VSQTPDRRPGALEEDEEIRLITNAVPPTQVGAFNINGSAFQLRDVLGTYDPRSATGITEAAHETLDTLVHQIDETSYDELTYSGAQVTVYLVWTSAAKTQKVREEQYTYNADKTVSQLVAIQYDGVGVENMRFTESYTYNTSKRVQSITRTKVP